MGDNAAFIKSDKNYKYYNDFLFYSFTTKNKTKASLQSAMYPLLYIKIGLHTIVLYHVLDS
jgi:hypothetical protein